MADKTNTQVTDTLGQVLCTVDDISGTLSTVQSVDGTATALQLSTSTVNANGTLQVGGYNFTRSGNYGCTFTVTGTTALTLPTSGTLVTTTSTALGTIATGTWQATVIGGTYGGTGVNNGSSTITIGGNVTFSGAYTFTGTVTGNTSVTFPTSGILVNSAVTTLSSLVSVGTITTGTWSATAVGATKGGTGQTSYTKGDTLYASASNTLSKLAGNTTTTKKYREQYGDGSAVTSDSWSQVSLSAGVTGTLPVANGGTGQTTSNVCIQRVRSQTASLITSTTLIPFDNTVPQNTEGVQVTTVTITPTNASNILEFEGTVFVANSAVQEMTVALFQDSTASAVGAVSMYLSVVNQNVNIPFKLYVTAGTTSATTFKLRVGGNNAGTTTVNGNAGATLFASTCYSTLFVSEWAT